MCRHKSNYDVLIVKCSTRGCKNIPTKMANGMPFCTFCFQKLIDAELVREYQHLSTLQLEHK